nr:MAG TPA: hypothetical protein [Caudoviricetes sp.]
MLVCRPKRVVATISPILTNLLGKSSVFFFRRIGVLLKILKY